MKPLLLALVGVVLGGCDASTRPAVQATAPMSPVRSDLDGLGQWMNLPAGTRSARWSVRALGGGGRGVPGPTDTALTAYVRLEPSAWAKLTPVSEAASSAVEPPPEVDLRALLDDAEPGKQSADKRLLEGPAYEVPQLAKSPYRVSRAIRWRDGLYVELFTM